MNLPNRLSMTRLLLTPPFIGLCYAPIENAHAWALVVFLVASLTDLLDGIIARRYKLITNFGKLFDPLADKILMASALTMLAIERQLPAWVVISILAREFFVTGIRQIAVSQGVVLAAEKLGKHKMVWQVITVTYFLAHMAAQEPLFAFARPWFEVWLLSPPVFGAFTTDFTAALTLISGFSYFWKNRKLFSDA